jgi:hypothetical protein
METKLISCAITGGEEYKEDDQFGCHVKGDRTPRVETKHYTAEVRIPITYHTNKVLEEGTCEGKVIAVEKQYTGPREVRATLPIQYLGMSGTFTVELLDWGMKPKDANELETLVQEAIAAALFEAVRKNKH